MAVLFIAEFTDPTVVQGGLRPVAFGETLAEQTVAIGVGSVQSSAFNAKTKMIRVHTDAICSIAIGSNPTATATKMRLAANQTEYFEVKPAYKIAVIVNT